MQTLSWKICLDISETDIKSDFYEKECYMSDQEIKKFEVGVFCGI